MKFNVRDEVYVIGDYCAGHGFAEDEYPIPVTILHYTKESREGDPIHEAQNFQEYLVEDEEGFEQWVAEEDLSTDGVVNG